MLKTQYHPLEIRELPKAPHWLKALGVGIVVMGLAIGTGELIMWPHLVTKHGLGILWGAFLGITIQFLINKEVGRLALATGESFFTAISRKIPFLVFFWLISAVLLYIWPGWATAIGTTLKELFGMGNYLVWAWASLGLVLVFTFTGKIAYQVLEKTLKIIVPIFFVLLLIISFSTLKPEHLLMAGKGIINIGWLPPDIDLPVFIGATVFAGAGGLLNLCVSLWYRDKGMGMGKYAGKITNPITGRTEAMAATGFTFPINETNLKNWRAWFKFMLIDQGVIFWLLGSITLALLSMNAYAILTPKGLAPEGLQVAVVQAHIFGEHWGIFGYKLFLVMAFLMLFAVMWTVIDAFTRIVTDIIYVNSRQGPYTNKFSVFQKVSAHQLYYGLITSFVIISALLIPLKQPLIFLTISSVLGAVTMVIYIPMLIYLNNTQLAKPIRPGIITNILLAGGFLFYAVFTFLLIVSKIK
jgi:hypothetical protein